jgi:hypothetical protein
MVRHAAKVADSAQQLNHPPPRRAPIGWSIHLGTVYQKPTQLARASEPYYNELLRTVGSRWIRGPIGRVSKVLTPTWGRSRGYW